MRGHRPSQTCFVSLINVEALIPASHPIRAIKRMCDEVLRGMDGFFEEMYAGCGAPSVPPETLLKGKVLQALYTVRSDRQLCARMQTDLMFRWFVDLPLEAEVFDASTYSKNQERLLRHEVADLFFSEVVELARRHGWVSDEHFSVDATLIGAWASIKSFRPKGQDQGPGGGNTWTDFKGHKRGNDTHASTTDPEAKLLRKGEGKEAVLCFAGHAAMGSAAARQPDRRSARRARREPRQHRSGLCVHFEVRPSVGESESDAAVDMLVEMQNRGFTPRSIGADRGYHDTTFVEGCRERGVEPHPARRADRPGVAVAVTLAHQVSQRCRKRIEEIFGWMKTTGCFRKSRYTGIARTHAQGQYVAAACNLVRMARFACGDPPGPVRAGA